MQSSALRAEYFLSELGIDDYKDIDTKLFAECLGMKVVHLPLPGCDGCPMRFGMDGTILCNNQAYQSRRRFTVAHELGHWFLHPTQSQDILLTEENVEPRRVHPSGQHRGAAERIAFPKCHRTNRQALRQAHQPHRRLPNDSTPRSRCRASRTVLVPQLQGDGNHDLPRERWQPRNGSVDCRPRRQQNDQALRSTKSPSHP